MAMVNIVNNRETSNWLVVLLTICFQQYFGMMTIIDQPVTTARPLPILISRAIRLGPPT